MSRNKMKAFLSRGDNDCAREIAMKLRSKGDCDGALWGMAVLAARSRDAGFFRIRVNEDILASIKETSLLIEVVLSHYWTVGLWEASESLINAATRIQGVVSNRADHVRALAEFVASLSLEQTKLTCIPLPYTFNFHFMEGFRLPLIYASIDGSTKRLPFILDTGAPTSAISAVVATESTIHGRPDIVIRSFDGAGRPINIYPGLLQMLEIAELNISNVPIMVMSFPENLQVAGIISPFDIFRNVSVDLDFNAGSVNLGISDQTHKRMTDLIWEEGRIIIRAMFSGLVGFFLVDTGAGASFLCVDVAESLGWKKELATVFTGLAIAGTSTYFKGMDICIEVMGFPATNITMLVQDRLGDGDNPNAIKLSGVLGMDWLSKNNVRIFVSPINVYS